MLRVTIELVPNGDEELAQNIATMLIANDNTGTLKTGNYAYVYDYSDRPDDPEIGLVKRFPRNDGAWALISRVLRDRFAANGNEITDELLERLKVYNALLEEE